MGVRAGLLLGSGRGRWRWCGRERVGVRERLLLGIVLMLHHLAEHLLALGPPGFCSHQGLAAGRAAEKTKVIRELACQAL